MSQPRDPITGQPVGVPVDTTPAQLPGPVALQGRHGRIEKLTAQHAPALWQVFAGHEAIWTYISTDGPFSNEAEFSAFIAKRAAAPDPYAYAILDNAGKAVGYFTGYRRYEWKCNALNAPSWRAALRYGFVHEGVLRQHLIAKGRNRDNAYFSMLDSEWPQRKASFERWLSPENFTADGRQILSLRELNGSPA